MNDIQGHYKRSDNGEQSFFLIKLNLHTNTAKRLLDWQVRELLAVALENSSRANRLVEDIDFTIEIAKYYDKEGE